AELRSKLAAMNPAESMAEGSNQVDELRYVFLVSQVELVDDAATLEGVKYSGGVEGMEIAVVDAEGKKCERCWNYSTHVGDSADDPTICERCVSALKGTF
ncbi:MAG: zinc finger domain-containing protein, partial [Cyanobacteria bacterium J06635_11]